MTLSATFRRLRSRRAVIALAVAALLLGLGAPQARAWYHLRAARSALERYHPEDARASLAVCLKVWPDSPEVRLLASRAARQAGDTAEAERQLRACQRLAGAPSDEIAFEWALNQAAAGNLWEVDEYLQRRAEQDPGLGPLVWEALAEGYLRMYRTLAAMACLEHWLAADPDNVRALELRGLTYVTGRGVKRGTEDYRRVLELDPSRDATRWRLVQGLLDLGAYDEAQTHLEHFARRDPDDPEVVARLARCHNILGRGDLARQTLDDLLARHPDHWLALRTRGQFAMADDKPAEAEKWLRRATEVWPHDYQVQWLFFQALQQQPGRGEEARKQLKVVEEVKDRSERLSELRSRKLAEHPLDPALHHEMGSLLILTGYPEVGEKWLLTALSLDPGYRPAHASLADYYGRRGDAARAADHRQLAGTN